MRGHPASNRTTSASWSNGGPRADSGSFRRSNRYWSSESQWLSSCCLLGGYEAGLCDRDHSATTHPSRDRRSPCPFGPLCVKKSHGPHPAAFGRRPPHEWGGEGPLISLSVQVARSSAASSIVPRQFGD